MPLNSFFFFFLYIIQVKFKTYLTNYLVYYLAKFITYLTKLIIWSVVIQSSFGRLIVMLQEVQLHNRQLYLDTLWQSCQQRPAQATSSNASDNYFAVDSPHKTDKHEEVPQFDGIPPFTGQTLALLLIELVAPDVIYNGIPWMCEDYIKVTIER